MPQTMNGLVIGGTLPTTTEVIKPMHGIPLPATVWVRPSSDTITVSYSTDGGTNYQTWPNGAVTAYSQDILTSGITHLKFVATTGNSSNQYGVC
jgi:hypothetical protein